MKIPIFEEIILSDFNEAHIKSTIAGSRIGRAPRFINLSTLKKTDLIALVPVLEQIFADLNLHPRFPYPTYLICHAKFESIFPIARSTKELPEHFFKKVKRPNNKELQLFNRLGLKVDKLNNLDCRKILDQFVDTSVPQKKLYEISKELYFLEMIFDKLNKPSEKAKKQHGI